ncbi:penicillin acylase family protein [Neoasaia chiangmaiensis]|uniref:penicillin acylase family protein n=1 Tax=Neoasaia chiangmaiensis TaxID=320497 RepID=UPI00098A4B94|nr:penicillin acylase family protein [Neoasaia chiangmaiensis]
MKRTDKRLNVLISNSSLSLRRRHVLLAGAAGLLTACATGGPVRRVRGVRSSIEIADDRFGVPHIRAASVEDAYFGDGYVAARDRLLQLDFDHRQGLGALAAVFGAAFVPSDTASRLFQFQGDVEAELDALDPRVRACAQAYVDGINAFLDATERDPALLPPIFDIFGYRPLRWELRDLIRVRAEATGNTKAEIRRARLAARGALDMDALMRPLEPAWTLRVPDGLDVHAVSEADLGWFGVLQKGPPSGAAHAAGRPVQRRANEGSNAWVVAPGRTTTGRPILANDPHLDFGQPGPRHVVHLTAPGLDVIGGGLPGMPGVMQGHNDRIAWGRTNFHIDQEDLFVLRTDPARPDHYLHHGEWVPMVARTVTIAVKDAPDQTATLHFAAQGPVISQDPAHHRAVAVAATWLAPGANGLLANIGINLARDWTEFRQALRLHTSPTNFLYADVDGHIGWQAAGGLPARASGHDGLMPAPGDGRYDWRGLQTLDDLPHVLDPAPGWFASSNQMNLPPGYDQTAHRVSFEWSPPYRYQRVAQVLTAREKTSVADCAALQHDTQSRLAREIAALVPDAPDLAAETALLRGWDGNVAADSAAAALYEVWWTEMGRALHERIVPEKLRDLVPELFVTVTEGLLTAPDARLGSDPVAARDMLMIAALRAAKAELTRRLGGDAATWRWGALHSVTIRHSLARVPQVAAAYPPVGGPAFASGGDAYTVQARWYDASRKVANPYEATGGASYLMVCDVGAWDNALYLNLPGQSDDPRSPHYDDVLPDWLAGRMRPMLFSAPAIAPHITTRQKLLPEGGA